MPVPQRQTLVVPDDDHPHWPAVERVALEPLRHVPEHPYLHRKKAGYECGNPHLWVPPAVVGEKHLHEVIGGPGAGLPAQVMSTHSGKDTLFLPEATPEESAPLGQRKTRKDPLQVFLQKWITELA